MRRFRNLLREPLVHFLLIGALLFLLFALRQQPGPEAAGRIVVDAGQVKQMAAQFRQTWMRPPTAAELQGMIDSFVRDEIYYREALALGLDRDDRVMRGRMRQKLEFILEDLSDEAPTDRQLAGYLEDHADDFRIEPRVTFQQIYLSPDGRPDPAADARRLLPALEAGADPAALGDPSLLPGSMKLASTSGIARTFGREFADALAELSPGEWQGPLDSGLGVHLVRVSEREHGRLPALEEIRPIVEREWLAERRRELRELAYRRLREGYDVVVELPAAGDAGTGDSGVARTGADR